MSAAYSMTSIGGWLSRGLVRVPVNPALLPGLRQTPRVLSACL